MSFSLFDCLIPWPQLQLFRLNPVLPCLQSRHYYCDLLSRSFWDPKLQSRSHSLPSPRGLDTLYVHSITSPPLAACLACLELDLQARTEREREGENTWEGEGQGYAMALGLLNLLTAYRNYVDTSGWEKQSTAERSLRRLSVHKPAIKYSKRRCEQMIGFKGIIHPLWNFFCEM